MGTACFGQRGMQWLIVGIGLMLAASVDDEQVSFTRCNSRAPWLTSFMI